MTHMYCSLEVNIQACKVTLVTLTRPGHLLSGVSGHVKRTSVCLTVMKSLNWDVIRVRSGVINLDRTVVSSLHKRSGQREKAKEGQSRWTVVSESVRGPINRPCPLGAEYGKSFNYCSHRRDEMRNCRSYGDPAVVRRGLSDFLRKTLVLHHKVLYDFSNRGPGPTRGPLQAFKGAT